MLSINKSSILIILFLPKYDKLLLLWLPVFFFIKPSRAIYSNLYFGLWLELLVLRVETSDFFFKIILQDEIILA